MSSTCDFHDQPKPVTLRSVQRGVDASLVLQRLLAERGWTQEQLAEKMRMRRTEVTAHFNGKRLGEQTLPRFASAFGITPDALREEALATEAVAAYDEELDHLLQRLGESPDEAVALVARALQLLGERVRLLERPRATEVRRAMGNGTT